jgi:hypothetical protein
MEAVVLPIAELTGSYQGVIGSYRGGREDGGETRREGDKEKE